MRKEILDENVRLIHSIINYQKSGATKEVHELQQLLHKNLTYLATIADQTTNPAQRPLPIHGAPGQQPVQGLPPTNQSSVVHQEPPLPRENVPPPQQQQQFSAMPQTPGFSQPPTVSHTRTPFPPSGPMSASYMPNPMYVTQGTVLHQSMGGLMPPQHQPVPVGAADDRSFAPQRAPVPAPSGPYGYMYPTSGQPPIQGDMGMMPHQMPRPQPSPLETGTSDQRHTPSGPDSQTVAPTHAGPPQLMNDRLVNGDTQGMLSGSPAPPRSAAPSFPTTTTVGGGLPASAPSDPDGHFQKVGGASA
ncbi:unnamed protein product [Schistocephalus solidus]|uniref:SSXT domain-containing protein n=3 Tax=Schistocephalus solidus TaxID=70667 RepID=A0A183SF43_SCHSO|nr:unnamed protein product [Schistocephalus solidus]